MLEPFEAPAAIQQALLILDSYARVLGKPLLEAHGTPTERARALYRAPFVVLSHGTAVDPVFNYGNLQAQQLFEFDWESLTQLPSRLSAEPVNQAERQRLLESVSSRGYIDDYAGIRISRTGRRFRIERATVWNLMDEAGHRQGQAATFADWTPV
ncbi:MAG TPA: MEKHLA domain-containing protein [Polyangiaceae bacterium]|nr:MEKHLA domain-containing protein [Polyangiaceae bacterium]